MVGQSDAIPDQRRVTGETAERLRVVVCLKRMQVLWTQRVTGDSGGAQEWCPDTAIERRCRNHRVFR